MEGLVFRSSPEQVALTLGSCATGTREPCQVGNEAALSDAPCVSQGHLGRVNCFGNVRWNRFEVRRTEFDIKDYCSRIHRTADGSRKLASGSPAVTKWRRNANRRYKEKKCPLN